MARDTPHALADPVELNHPKGDTMSRKYIDCREMPSENNCDLAMSGSEEHLVEAASIHVITPDQHEDIPELREQIRQAMKDEFLACSRSGQDDRRPALGQIRHAGPRMAGRSPRPTTRRGTRLAAR
jgi:hypothetical protein